MPSRNRKPIDISAAAQKLLGFKSLRPGQREAIQSLLEGRDTLLVQPTGSGKSAVYQIAGSLLDGSTVIVSPLIALQKDQADSIQAARLDETAVVNSTLSASEHQEILDRIEQGEIEFIFLAPEQLRSPEILDRLRSAGVSLFAIDEAHCISHWGHDFRPDYLELAHIIEALDRPVVLAMTATAPKEVRAEIVERLGMRDPRVFVHGFDRPNISLRVDLFSDEDEKLESVVKRVEFAEKPGIVYVATHKHAETLAKELKDRGVEAVFYHGGLKARDREEIQDRFMKGDVPVIVAIGRLVEKKGFEYLIDAAALLKDDCPTLRVVIAGEGDLDAPLRARAASAGVARSPEDIERLNRKGMLFAAGLITGEALVGVAVAIIIVATGKGEPIALPAAFQFGGWLGFLLLLGLMYVLYRTGTSVTPEGPATHSTTPARESR